MDGLEVRMEAQKRLVMNSLPEFSHVSSNIYVWGCSLVFRDVDVGQYPYSALIKMQ